MINEEMKKAAWNSYKTFEKFKGFGEPTYSYNIGDSVIVGNLHNCVIEEVVNHDGLIVYGYSHDARKHINGNASGREYSYSPWYNVRPVTMKEGNTDFTLDENIDIRFTNTSLESLLNKFYLHGVDMTPDYQRDYVWEESDKESLLDSIFRHIEIGKFAFIKRDYSHDVTFEILDGKQRLSTLLDFYENRLAYRGFYYNELSANDRHTFLDTPVSVGETGELTKEQIYRYFYTLNKSGKVMDEEHLQKIKARLQCV